MKKGNNKRGLSIAFWFPRRFERIAERSFFLFIECQRRVDSRFIELFRSPFCLFFPNCKKLWNCDISLKIVLKKKRKKNREIWQPCYCHAVRNAFLSLFSFLKNQATIAKRSFFLSFYWSSFLRVIELLFNSFFFPKCEKRGKYILYLQNESCNNRGTFFLSFSSNVTVNAAWMCDLSRVIRFLPPRSFFPNCEKSQMVIYL